MAEEKVTININDLADAVGVQEKQITLRNGGTRMVKSWEPSQLPKVWDKVSPNADKNAEYVIDGAAPAWLVAAVSHACCRAAHCFSLRLQFCGKLKSPSCEEYLSQRAVFYSTLFSFVLDPGIR